MVFCNMMAILIINTQKSVTILILIDGFLQFKMVSVCITDTGGHNPYFNRWFSAIRNPVVNKTQTSCVTILILIDGFLQCQIVNVNGVCLTCHNPYFNRWFSAI